MSINQGNGFILFALIALVSCQNRKVVYEISDNYSGPCVVFMYKTNQFDNKSSTVFIEKGLGRINEKNVTQPFYFFSREKHNSLEIIEIGKLEQAKKNKKYIFELVYGYSSSACMKEDMHLIYFFYGYKNEYLNWSKVYHDDFESFEKAGIDWCAYYKSGIR